MKPKFGVRILATGLVLASAASVAIAADVGKPGDTPTVEKRGAQEVLSNEIPTVVANNYATENTAPMGLERVPAPYARAPSHRKVALERAPGRPLIIFGIAY